MTLFVLFLCIIYIIFGIALISKAEFFALKIVDFRKKLDNNFTDFDGEFLKRYFFSMKFVGYSILAISAGTIICFVLFNILIF